MTDREWNRVLRNSSVLALDLLVRTFFGDPRAFVDFRDGTLYAGGRWADAGEETGFRRWLVVREGVTR